MPLPHLRPAEVAGDVLIAIIERLGQARDYRAILAAIHGSLRRLIGAQGVTFVLRDGQHCFYLGEDAEPPLGWTGMRTPSETCIAGWCMRNSQEVTVPDISREARLQLSDYEGTGIKSLTMVPVGSRQPVAAIGAYWLHEHTSSESELECLRAVSRAAEQALDMVAFQDSLRRSMHQAESADHTKTRLLAAASHDLRQPVHVMNLLLDVLENGDGSSRQKALAAMRRALDTMDEVIRALLDLSRLDMGAIAPKVESVRLGELLERAGAELRPAAEQRSLKVRVVPTAHRVLTDPLLLATILRNFGNNAVRYTDVGGVLIGCRCAGPSHVRICITDTGRGIDRERQAEVFEGAYKLDKGVRENGQGLGLGLATVDRLARLLNHPVGLVSRSGRGSTFWVKVPVDEEAAATRE